MNLVLLQTGSGGGTSMYLMLGIGVIFMVFFVYLPQRKKTKEAKALQEGLKTGDAVVTTGGFHGKVITTEGALVIVELSKGNNVKIESTSITSVIPKA